MPGPVPPNMVVGDIIEITVEQRLFAQTVLNVFHYRLDVASVPAYDSAMESLGTKLKEALELWNLIQLCETADVEFVNLHLQCIAATRYARISIGGGETGVRAGSCKVPELTAVIVQRSLLAHHPLVAAGRGYHRNTFIAGVPDDDIEDGLLSNEYKEGPLESLANYLCTELTDESTNVYYPVIYHRNAAAGPPYTDVETATVKSEVRSMRRRVVGRGI